MQGEESSKRKGAGDKENVKDDGIDKTIQTLMMNSEDALVNGIKSLASGILSIGMKMQY